MESILAGVITFAIIIFLIFLICLIKYLNDKNTIKVDITGKRNVDQNKLLALLREQFTLEYIKQKLNITERLKQKTPDQIIIHIAGVRYKAQKTVVSLQLSISYQELLGVYEKPVINAKYERSKMTKALREKIKKRDNYTCQCCGKYMPDEVGLHIDHIIPVSKGGKTEEDNLQVLCSKCNLRKSNKINE